jgi:NAD(P)-dependent dehydrogenase (short-subunit alcohol dehydrogenase family)
MKQVILITGASSGFGELGAKALAQAGHTVYASMRDIAGKNRPKVSELAVFAKENKVDLLTVELDVGSQESADTAIRTIVAKQGRIDVVIHNAGHMTFGPVEAYTPEQIASEYDINVVSTQRVNRAALPVMQKQRSGLLIWNSSSSAAGGMPPYLGAYFAAKAGMDALAVAYAKELTRWGIETSIVVPGAFTKGTNHFANASPPEDKARAAEYEDGPFHGFAEQVKKAFASIVPDDADVSTVAEAMVAIVNAPRGKRPFRVGVDATDDGSMVVNPVLDRVRAEMLRRLGLGDLLTLNTSTS